MALTSNGVEAVGGGSVAERNIGSRGIRVAVRVRPITGLDASTECAMLTIEGREVLLQNRDGQKGMAKKFVFDSVFGTAASQVNYRRCHWCPTSFSSGAPQTLDTALPLGKFRMG
jgi:hypothetical protein